MHLENRDLRIWYELLQNKVGLFIKGCNEDENIFNGFYVVAWSLTQGGVTFNDGY